jgi:hypothetical protein
LAFNGEIVGHGLKVAGGSEMEMSKCLVERLVRVIVFVTLSISLCSAGEPAEYMDVVTNTTAMRSFREYNEEDFSNLRKSAIKGLREYRDRDLRFLKREESERLITLANRCREVPYWPAFVVEMASAFEPRLTVLVESPLLPEKNPPDGIIRMSARNNSGSLRQGASGWQRVLA